MRELKVILLSQLGDKIDAAENFILLSQEHPNKNKQKFYKHKVREIVRSHLNIEEVLSILKKNDFATVHSLAHLRAATHYYDKKQFLKSKITY